MNCTKIRTAIQEYCKIVNRCLRRTHGRRQHLCHCTSAGIVAQLRAWGTNISSELEKPWKLKQDHPKARDLAKHATEPTIQVNCCGPVVARLYPDPVLPAVNLTMLATLILRLYFSFWREMMVAGLPALLSEIGEGFILLCCPTPFPQLSHLARSISFFGRSIHMLMNLDNPFPQLSFRYNISKLNFSLFLLLLRCLLEDNH